MARNIVKFTKAALTLLFFCIIMLVSPATAQDNVEEYLFDLSLIKDYKMLSGMEERLAPYGDDLMGDMIDKNTGGLLFNIQMFLCRAIQA